MSTKIKIGDTVRCTHAATSWYKVGNEYKVLSHPVEKVPSVKGGDGFYDILSMCVSKFEKV